MFFWPQLFPCFFGGNHFARQVETFGLGFLVSPERPRVAPDRAPLSALLFGNEIWGCWRFHPYTSERLPGAVEEEERTAPDHGFGEGDRRTLGQSLIGRFRLTRQLTNEITS